MKVLYEEDDTGWDVTIFGVAQGKDPAGLIRAATSAMPEARPKFAIQAALGLELDDPKLTDRRERAAKIIGVSERTLIRDEEIGFRLLDTLIDREFDEDHGVRYKRSGRLPRPRHLSGSDC
ncbi:hypothetical protein Q0F99_19005 [Rathayibacter oskolensis]|uniref:hypothetical protein n=1 Tax=Rathayibacter oskolensis TaxID=1891671 RepID=UPI00265FFBD3|nr:hypothetical protein [Rathayibacter oskolensis]WKK71429.1 hypothetical protein Q0F99_19005 [Rathayibacter oskolensis]